MKPGPFLPAPSKGHVEVFRLYDGDYHDVYVDGVHVDFIAKEPIFPLLLMRKFRKVLVAQAGLTNELDLRFSYVDAYDQVEEADDCADDYAGQYAKTVDLQGEAKFTGVDLDALEDLAAYYG